MTAASRSRLLVEGLIAGWLGYVVVAVCVGVLDIVGGRSFFHTPSVLGQAVVGGFGPPAPGRIQAGAVFAFNGIHLLVFLLVGLVVTFVVFEVELHPVLWYAGFFALLALLLLSFFVLAVIAAPLRAELDAATLIVANTLAALSMGWYLATAHPRLLQRVREHGDPEAGGES